jgi:hypothetical protein
MHSDPSEIEAQANPESRLRRIYQMIKYSVLLIFPPALDLTQSQTLAHQTVHYFMNMSNKSRKFYSYFDFTTPLQMNRSKQLSKS